MSKLDFCKKCKGRPEAFTTALARCQACEYPKIDPRASEARTEPERSKE